MQKPDRNEQAESGSPAQLTAGGAIFGRLKALGIDYVFVNSGTDFPPVIEGLAEATAKRIDLPKPVVVPHEHAAMGMAYGYYLLSGRAQAVMLHTNVGLSNGATGAINAACENVPVFIMSGRTPVTEKDRFGARTVPIGWGQEMRDQAALIRESCKWDYELRYPEQIGELIDRGHAIANSTPKGPVYLSLPREVLCEQIEESEITAERRFRPSHVSPNPEDIETAANWLTEAEAPLIIAQHGSGDANGFAALSRLAEEYGIAVSSWWATRLAVSTEHPCHIGPDASQFLANADVVLVLDSLAPWWPDRHKLKDGAKVIHIGPDPIFSRFPVRNFRSDLSICGELALAIPKLYQAMKVRGQYRPDYRERLERIATETAEFRARQQAKARAGAPSGITKQQVSAILGDVLAGKTSSVFSELGVFLGPLRREQHDSWFQEPFSGGLGWSFPATMGAKLAAPERICIAAMGDGSYMFSNPVACHQIAEAMNIPVLMIILNNQEWGAVRQSVKQLYPDGVAAKANLMPLTSLSPTPDFCKVAEASRAWARRVEQADQLADALREAVRIVEEEERQALVDARVCQD